eukprot:COSAG06_NODE_421_length_15973_cov_18.743795_12_plen_151_part_00
MYAADKDGFIRILMVILESLTKGADDKTYRHTGNSLCHIMQLLNPEQRKDRDVLWVFLNVVGCLEDCRDVSIRTPIHDHVMSCLPVARLRSAAGAPAMRRRRAPRYSPPSRAETLKISLVRARFSCVFYGEAEPTFPISLEAIFYIIRLY